jgi:hypothetical protein
MEAVLFRVADEERRIFALHRSRGVRTCVDNLKLMEEDKRCRVHLFPTLKMLTSSSWHRDSAPCRTDGHPLNLRYTTAHASQLNASLFTASFHTFTPPSVIHHLGDASLTIFAKNPTFYFLLFPQSDPIVSLSRHTSYHCSEFPANSLLTVNKKHTNRLLFSLPRPS